MRWHKLGEVENEYTPGKIILSAILVPKIFTIGRNLAKFWQKISLHSFFLRHGVVTTFGFNQQLQRTERYYTKQNNANTTLGKFLFFFCLK